MKKKPIPQSEFIIPNEPFALVIQSALDGDCVQHDRDQSARDRAASAIHQLTLDPQPSTESKLLHEQTP